ncbi:hypothetical protein ACIG87_15145 [Micromonospora sp. NPDC051925]|uniref:hypothetical protein n=1 Tax=Micromonospora sp. NPDC051925 TaxID=3364288 RepID=UPI0037C8B012
MTVTADDFTTDADRWGFRTGARFVGPDEWEADALTLVGRRRIYLHPLVRGLAAAADDGGLILDYWPNRFYEGPLSDAMRNEDDEPDWKLAYDRFTAMTLSVFIFELVEAGLLATRGNGDSTDYRLALLVGGGA